MDTIDGMRTFLAVARKQSFTGGAKTLGMSSKLASKYIGQLEAKLGAQLFNRTTRSVALTPTGEAYLRRCAAIVEQIEELEDIVQARHSEHAGNIKISASTGFGSERLIHALKPFQLKYPNVGIDLHLSDNRIAIIEEGFDLAIRFGDLEDSSLMARKLFDIRVVIVASPEYLTRHGEPKAPQALSTHECIVPKFSTTAPHWPFMVNGKEISVTINGLHKANSPRAVAHMSAGGIGITRVPIYVAEPFLETGQLKILFENYEPTTIPLYAVYPNNRHLTARIRALIDHLANYFSTS